MIEKFTSLKSRFAAPGSQTSIAKITVPFLPKVRLLSYLQTQCETADGERGAFHDALDLDVGHIDPNAAFTAVKITGLELEPDGALVTYDVHYRVFNGCAGVDLSNHLCKTVYGIKSAAGWEFDEFVMPMERSTADEL